MTRTDGPRVPGRGAPSRGVDDWFHRRTTSLTDYDVADLIGLRRARGLSTSVVLPARDEAATIEGVVAAAMALCPDLIDEVVVVDGESTDRTAELAAGAGARVHVDAQLEPRGPCLGKGDALWRSLRVTSGDLVVFADTDVRNPSPDTFIGLLGPLLADPDVQFVKGFYDRPLSVDGVRHGRGGGRVTELLARPLLNLFWPELSGLAQPLAGEYAAVRELLVHLPFFTGYGVELGLLVDVVDRVGIDAVAQVDLGVREHRNAELPALSRMAYGIAQVATHRLETQERARFAMAFDPVYRQVERDAGHAPRLVANQVEVVERPPVVDDPA